MAIRKREKRSSYQRKVHKIIWCVAEGNVCIEFPGNSEVMDGLYIWFVLTTYLLETWKHSRRISR